MTMRKKGEEVVFRSPCRVDLAGGTLDLWPLYLFVGGARTLNFAIDLWTQVRLVEREDKRWRVHAEDIGIEAEFSSRQDFLNSTQPELSLLRVQVAYWEPWWPRAQEDQGFDMYTSSESPVGGGLGGSSSLIISLMKAFYALCGPGTGPDQGKTFSFWNWVEAAHNIEAQVLLTPTGTQDYVPALAGSGFHQISYEAQGIHWIQEKKIPYFIRDNFFLVYTGRSHHSGLNNFTVLEKAVAKETQTIGALKDLKAISDHWVQRRDFSGDWFTSEYEARLRLSSAFSSPEIEALKRALPSYPIKICGAGGGGCVWVVAPSSARDQVHKVCGDLGLKLLERVRPLEGEGA